MRRALITLLAVALLSALAAMFAYRQAMDWLHAPIATLTTPVVYELPRGSSVTTASRDLAARGLMSHPRVFAAWARLSRQASAIKAGEYELKPGMSPNDILLLLRSGEVILHSITVVEGSTFAEFRRLLAENPYVRQEVANAESHAVMDRLGSPGVHPEGEFFPDTYSFPKGTSDLAILGMAHQRLKAELASAWRRRAEGLPLASEYEALILASIVEKETAQERERALISGVFQERLKRGMRLQTDPTVIYGLGVSYDGNIHRADLERDTPYNTYTRPGLPPTPICLPGAASLAAAVQPEMSGALFFVATAQGDGSHYFSRTLPEHDKAVQRYLKALRAQQGK